MALPIAHATAAYVIHRLDGRQTRFLGWPRVLTYMAIANLPDADFLLGFAVGRPGLYHRTVSHTLVAAVVFGVVAALISRVVARDRWGPAALAFGAVYASHLLVDVFTIDARAPAGVQLLWPFSDVYYIAPVTLFQEILIDGGSRLGFIDSIVGWPAVAVLGRELMIGAVVILGLATIGAVRRAIVLRASSREEDIA